MHIERVDGRKAILHCDICEGDHMLIAAQGELDPQEHFFLKDEEKIVCASCRAGMSKTEQKKLEPLTKDKLPKKKDVITTHV